MKLRLIPTGRLTTSTRLIVGLISAIVVLATGVQPAGAALPRELISVSVYGGFGNAFSWSGHISPDNRFVCFNSDASDLVRNDKNNYGDVFLRDRRTHTTRLVDLNSSGRQATFGAMDCSMSADSRYIAFSSMSPNLGPVREGTSDVFVRDLLTGNTRMVSTSASGKPANRYVFGFALSANGHYVAFDTDADNLVPGDTNGFAGYDTFRKNLRTGSIRRISVAPDGGQGDGQAGSLAISASGRYIAFSSSSSNLVPDDSNDTWDVFVRDRSTHTTQRVSVSSRGIQANRDSGDSVAITPNGRYVLFSSYASNLVPGDNNDSQDIFVHDRRTGNTTLVSRAINGAVAGGSYFASISADGRYVLFDTNATNMVPGHPTYSGPVIRDLTTATTRAAVSFGTYATTGSISPDGRYASINVNGPPVPGDTNDDWDAYLYGPYH